MQPTFPMLNIDFWAVKVDGERGKGGLGRKMAVEPFSFRPRVARTWFFAFIQSGDCIPSCRVCLSRRCRVHTASYDHVCYAHACPPLVIWSLRKGLGRSTPKRKNAVVALLAVASLIVDSLTGAPSSSSSLFRIATAFATVQTFLSNLVSTSATFQIRAWHLECYPQLPHSHS